MSNQNRGLRVAIAATATAVALAGVAGGAVAASAATAPIPPKPLTVEQVDARAAESMVQLGIEWSGTVSYIDSEGRYVHDEVPVTADYICSGWFVDGSGDIVTAGHCVDRGGAKAKIIDAYVDQLADAGQVDQQWIDANLGWAEQNWKVTNAKGGSGVDRAVVAYQSDRVRGAVLKDVTPASVIASRSADDEDVALLNVDAEDTPAMSLAATSPAVGQAVTAIGFPGSVQEVVRYDTLEASFKTGTISSRQVNDHGVAKLEVNADISGGMSGGPTIDALGNVVGLNSFGILGEDENFNFITDTVSLRKFLDREGVDLAKPVHAPVAKANPVHGLVLPFAGGAALLVLAGGALWTALSARRRTPRPVAPTSPRIMPLVTAAAPVPAARAHAHDAVVPALIAEATCPDGHVNPLGSVFCASCGSPLAVHRADEPELAVS